MTDLTHLLCTSQKKEIFNGGALIMIKNNNLGRFLIS